MQKTELAVPYAAGEECAQTAEWQLVGAFQLNNVSQSALRAESQMTTRITLGVVTVALLASATVRSSQPATTVTPPAVAASVPAVPVASSSQGPGSEANASRTEPTGPSPAAPPAAVRPGRDQTGALPTNHPSLPASQGGSPNWFQLIGAVGIGAIVTKLLDIFWLARITREADHRKWLREQRLAAYSDVAKDFLSLRLGGDQDHDNPFQAYAVASRAMLLAHNDQLSQRISRFIVDMDAFYQLNDDESKQSEAEKAYKALWDEARGLVSALRQALTEQA